MYRFNYVDADLVTANKQWRVAVNEFSIKAAELKDGDIDESQFQAWSCQLSMLQNLKLEEIIQYGRHVSQCHPQWAALGREEIQIQWAALGGEELHNRHYLPPPK